MPHSRISNPFRTPPQQDIPPVQDTPKEDLNLEQMSPKMTAPAGISVEDPPEQKATPKLGTYLRNNVSHSGEINHWQISQKEAGQIFYNNV
jgi:hypothetical protein